MNPESGGARLRVVLDSNVYISAFIDPKGKVFAVWQEAIRGRYNLLVSPAIIREVGRVLRERFGWEPAAITRQLKLIARVGELLSPRLTVSVITADPPDNRILECAVEGRADLIVTGNRRHLLRLKVCVHRSNLRKNGDWDM